MAARPLTDNEKDFAETLATALQNFASVQEKARAVVESGGDCREAFLSVVDEADREQVAMQWPYISMMLGV